MLRAYYRDMSALQTPEERPFPYLTVNLSPPEPESLSGYQSNPFEQKKLDDERENRRRDIAKAMAQESLRWEMGSIEREARLQRTPAHIADVINITDR